MEQAGKVYHRRGEPGGPGCVLGVLPVTTRDAEGNMRSAVLLDAGGAAGEIELLRTVAARLGVTWGKDEFGWWAALQVADFPSWSVWRQDDNGNKYLMKANLTESEASRVVAHYERLGHKQHYWAEDSKVVSRADG